MSHGQQHQDERRESHERFWLPLVVPAGIFLFALLVIYGLSRIFLELNDWSVGDVTMATPLAIAIAIVILGICALLATRPVPGAVVGMIAVLAMAGLTGGAIWAAVHEEEHHVVENGGVTPPPNGTPVDGVLVGLHDSPAFEVTVAPDSVPGGTTTFQVENVGTTLHNFRLIQTDLAPDALPYDSDSFIVVESELDIVASIPEFDPGVTETTEAELEPGSYVIICNVAAHYESGMYIAFTVTEGGGPGPGPGDGPGGGEVPEA
jgi:uncharacterized cupredoxin-like copper-binding protein